MSLEKFKYYSYYSFFCVPDDIWPIDKAFHHIGITVVIRYIFTSFGFLRKCELCLLGTRFQCRPITAMDGVRGHRALLANS
jgi:hypothetical protein